MVDIEQSSVFIAEDEALVEILRVFGYIWPCFAILPILHTVVVICDEKDSGMMVCTALQVYYKNFINSTF